jgi:hypothetical protein
VIVFGIDQKITKNTFTYNTPITVMFAFVICVLCSIRIDSPFCKICEDKSDDRFVKKKKLPLDDEFEENDSITEEQWESSDIQQA